MRDIDEKIRSIISVELQVDRQQVTENAVLLDLGMDSVSALNIIFALEETFDLPPIDVGEVAQIKTIADLESIVGKLVQSQASSAVDR